MTAQQLKQEGIQLGIQQGLQQGLQRGLQQGMQEGLKQGEALFLKRQLQRKFGQLSAIDTRRIDDADTKTLLKWGDKIFDANSLEDIFD